MTQTTISRATETTTRRAGIRLLVNFAAIADGELIAHAVWVELS